jgi:transcriptional regulator GlxA family with amidase domain
MQTRARTVVLFAFDEVELLDVAAPLQVLTLAGRRWNFRPFKVHVCAPAAGLVETRNQIRLAASVALADAPPAEVLFVAGGYGARRLLADTGVAKELARIGRGAEVVSAVGWGVALLARAGLLASERVAVAPEVIESVREHAPEAVLEATLPVVADGRVFSARASGASLDLGLAIVGRVLGPKLVTLVRSELGLSSDRIDVSYSN